jgi:hypothetical protein
MSPRLDEQPLLKEKIESLRQELGRAGEASEDRKFR